MTMLEGLVAAAVGLLGFGMVGQALFPALSAKLREGQRVEARRQLTVSLQRLAGEVRDTCSGGIVVGKEAVSLARLQEVSADGQACWENAVVLYAHRAGLLQRYHVPLGSGTSPRPICPEPQEFDSLMSRAGQTRTVARGLRFLRCSKPGHGLRLEVGVELGGYQAQAASTVLPRCEW